MARMGPPLVAVAHWLDQDPCDPAHTASGRQETPGLAGKARARDRVEREDVVALDAQCYLSCRGRRLASLAARHDRVPALWQAHVQEGVRAALLDQDHLTGQVGGVIDQA